MLNQTHHGMAYLRQVYFTMVPLINLSFVHHGTSYYVPFTMVELTIAC